MIITGECGQAEGLAWSLTFQGVLAEEGSVKMFLRGRPVPMLIPDALAPTYSLDTRSELPSSRLKLDWVYPLAMLPLCPLGTG